MRNQDLLFIDAQRYCWSNQTLIYVKPTYRKGVYRICISRNGREKLGHEEYEGTPTYKTEILKQGNKELKIKKRIPPVHEKIRELYIDIYQKAINN